MKKLKIQLLSSLLCIVFICQVSGQRVLSVSSNETSKITAEQVLGAARLVTRKNFKSENIKSLILEVDSITTISKANSEKKEYTNESKLFLLLPNQIRSEVYSDYSTNQQISIEKLDSTKYSLTSDTLVDGKPFYFGSNLSSIIPKITDEQKIASLKAKVFVGVFPITLDYSWHQGLSLKYLGEVETGQGKADMILLTGKDGTTYQLFFDRKSHLLTNVIETFFEPFLVKKETVRKYFYSDYREAHGLLIAHKISVQTEVFSMTEDRRITKFQVNPSFKSNLFEVTEENVNLFKN